MTTKSLTPPVNGKYGAPMGRRTDAADASYAGKVRLYKVPLDRGGYDPGGAYWGVGSPLYAWADEEGRGGFFRARSRNAAKLQLLAEMPAARFYR